LRRLTDAGQPVKASPASTVTVAGDVLHEVVGKRSSSSLARSDPCAGGAVRGKPLRIRRITLAGRIGAGGALAGHGRRFPGGQAAQRLGDRFVGHSAEELAQRTAQPDVEGVVLCAAAAPADARGA
jgi:hypothetical protein